MEKPKLIFLGGGGHALSCWDVAQACNQWHILGYTDLDVKNMPIPYLGTDEEALTFADASDVYFFLGVGHVGNTLIRRKLVEKINQYQGNWATLISPHAYISPLATISVGSIVHHRAVLNADAMLADHAIVNTGAILEHGSSVGSHSHISTNVVVNGDTHIGSDCLLGSGTVCYHQINIPDRTLVAAGSVVRRTIPSAGVYAGNPLQKLS